MPSYRCKSRFTCKESNGIENLEFFFLPKFDNFLT
jgi:hypothetical protein